MRCRISAPDANRQLGFRADHSRTLQGSDATRAAFLEELDRLTHETAARDYVLVGFSGCGVSAHAAASRSSGMRPDTDANLPAAPRRSR